MARPRRKLPPFGKPPRRNQAAYGRVNTEFLKGRVYQYRIPRRADSVGTVLGPALEVSREKSMTAAAGPFSVQGQRASDLEARTYRALLKLGWSDSNIDFQSPVLGGRQPGGRVIDFVVYGYGNVTAIAVNGSYWHGRGTNYQETLQDEAAIRSVMPSANYLNLWTSDLMNDEQAYRILLRRVGRGF